ncbi:MAG: hypothetical protein O7C98_07695 [Planctomycetota bacterium]|nr:hypothetical protein [Planctomycetota bacterium]
MRRLAIILGLFASAGPAVGDALVVTRAMKAGTIAEIFVEQGNIRVELEIGAADLESFGNVLADAMRAEGGESLPSAPTGKGTRLFAAGWEVKADGVPLVPRVQEAEARVRVQRDEITGEPVPRKEQEAEAVVFIRLQYALQGRPKTVSLKAPGGRVSLGFVLYHGGVPVTDFRYLSGEETVDLNWDDPWYSRFRNRNLRRQFDAPLSAFLYIEPFEVRQEIVCRPKDLQQWVDLGLEGKQVIPASAHAEVKRKVAQFLTGRNPVRVDGKPAAMKLDRIHFIQRSLRRTRVVDPPEDLPLVSATLGVIFVAATEGLPREVTMKWELFGAKFPQVPAVATDEAGGMPYVLSADDDVLRWQNFLTNPTLPQMRVIALPAGASFLDLPLFNIYCITVALALAGLGIRARSRRRARRYLAASAVAVLTAIALGGPGARPVPDRDERAEILEGLLHNVYRAVDHRDDGIAYDRLELSIAGDLLRQVFLQARRSIELENQGGARVKVQAVALVEHELKAGVPDGFAAECTWNVSGSVGHWGHVHRRTNQYRAALDVEPLDGVWKITGLEILGEVRLP